MSQETATKDPFEGFTTESTEPDPAPAEKAEKAQPADEDAGSASADKEAAADAAETTETEGDSKAPDDKEADKKPAKKSAQDRFDELTKKRREAERAAAEKDDRIAALEAEIAGLKTAGKKKDLTEEKPDVKADPDAPKPEDFEFGEFDSRYVSALAAHEAKKIVAAERAKDAETRQADAAAAKAREYGEKLDGHIRSGIEKFEDFESSLEALEKVDGTPSEEARDMILGSEFGAEILYHLGKNPSEAVEMASKSPVEQARYLGKLEAQFSAQKAASTKTEKPAVTKTPPPPANRVRGADGKFSAADDTDDFAAFEAKHTKKG